MKGLKRKWEICIIQHTHTDIGYTERQEVIEAFQIDYIRQAIVISESIDQGKKEWDGFRWTCESFWAVEKFLEQADEEWKERLIKAVKRGHIEISGNYLNLNELINYDVLKHVTQRSISYAKSIGINLTCALTADINGYSWGYAQGLYDIGIRNFFSCLHAHHGMFVGGLKQRPFYWETPNKDKLLVWMGEHYMLGNELGLAPGALGRYMIQDEFIDSSHSDKAFEIGRTRIERYLKNLEEEDYPYNFVPIMVSGLPTDNAPPNPQIVEHMHKWNNAFSDNVTLKMVTLDEFFQRVRACKSSIPVYSGDWPDWWAEGMASTPLPVKMFREAQRILEISKMLDPDGILGDKKLLKKAEDYLMLYAEHTWGYSASVSEPWTKLVHTLDYRKIGYANQAHEAVFRNYDKILLKKGGVSLYPQRPLRFKVINPFSHCVKECVRLYMDYWELSLFKNGFKVVEEATDQSLFHQKDQVARGTEVVVELVLKANEEKILHIKPEVNLPAITTKSFQDTGSEGICDIYYPQHHEDKIKVSEYGVETPLIKIEWGEEGIISWIDKLQQRELIRSDRDYNAFTPIYEMTQSELTSSSQCNTRRKMGRNRKGLSVKRYVGRLNGIKTYGNGDLFAKIELSYTLEGTSYFTVLLTVYKNQSRVDVSVRINKNNVWSPENLYLALPFCVDDTCEQQLWIEKTGVIMRPRIDQLPGSNTDFYCVQEGIGLTNNQMGLAIATPDTPLIQLGSLRHKPVRLHNPDAKLEDGEHIYSWIMNNFWETNFKATLGEFYELDYKIAWGTDLKTPRNLIDKCHTMNAGVVCFRVGE